MKAKLRILLVLSSLLIVACNEEKHNTNPINDDFALPFEIGYKITFDVYAVDKNNHKMSNSYWGTGLLECYKSEEKDGKEALFFKSYNEDLQEYDAEIYAIEDDVVYLHSDFADALIEEIQWETGFILPLKPKQKWMKFLDFENEAWHIALDSIYNFKVNSGNGIATGLLDISAKYKGNENVDFNIKSYSCRVYEILTKFDGIINDTIYDINDSLHYVTVPVHTEILIRQYASSELGKVRTIYSLSNVEIGDFDYDVFGYGTFLKNVTLYE